MALLPGYEYKPFVPSEAPPAERQCIPPGWYSFIIREAESKQNKRCTGMVLKLKYVVIACDEGDTSAVGYAIWDNLNLVNDSEMAVRIAQQRLAQICLACGIDEIQDDQELIGHTFRGLVEIENGRPPYGDQNRVKTFADVL